jgi:hypothetical protein
MSLTLDGNASARIAAAVRGVAWLVELDFTGGTLRYTTAPVDVTRTDIAYTYTGFGSLAEVSVVSESENTATTELVLSFALVNTAMLAATLGNLDTYRGRSVRLYLQLFDEAYQPVGAPVRRWTGTMQPVRVNRTASDPGGGPSTGRIELPCTRAGMARARAVQGLRLSNAQQQQRYSGDYGLQYVQTLIEKPSLWLSKRFQAQ